MPPPSLLQAAHVKATWGRRCDKLMFMSSEEDKELPTVALEGVREGREHLWNKTREVGGTFGINTVKAEDVGR